jgi:hypothetical protein
MTLRLSDLCTGEAICMCSRPWGDPCLVDLRATSCSGARCACGLPWDATRGPHTLTGIILPDRIITRILAREGDRLEADERREAVRAEDCARWSVRFGARKP